MNVWDVFLAFVRGDLHKSLVQAQAEKEKAMSGLHAIAHETKQAALAQLEESDEAHNEARQSIHSLRNIRAQLESRATNIGRTADRAAFVLEQSRREVP